jgi:DNA-binding FadR family transcriptional regulator
MALRLVKNVSQADRVFRKLAGIIVSGRRKPGKPLPPAEELARHFDVNRATVQEAFKLLERLKLVQIERGGMAKVLDFRRRSGLELLAVLAQQPTGQSDMLPLWLSIHRTRVTISADAAHSCARLAPAALKREILDLSLNMRQVADGPGLFNLSIRFWEKVNEGSGNLVYQLSHNTFITALSAPGVSTMAANYTAFELKQNDYLAPVAQAIAQSNADAAERETRKALQGLVDALERMVALRNQDPDSSAIRPTER